MLPQNINQLGKVVIFYKTVTLYLKTFFVYLALLNSKEFLRFLLRGIKFKWT